MSQTPYGYPFGGGQPPLQPYLYPPFNTYNPPFPQSGFASQQQQPQQLQQQQQQHPFQAPSYPNAPENYLAASQSAFDHNAGTIPGLGHPSTGHFPIAVNASWNHGGYSAVGTPNQFTAPTSHAPFSTLMATPTPLRKAPHTANAQISAQAFSPTRATEQTKDEPKRPPKVQAGVQPKPQVDNADSQDEGEITDGYFDDLYDDVSNQHSLDSQQPAVSPARSADNGDTDALDQETNFYDTDMEDASVAAQKTTGTQVRLRDGSKLVQEVERDRTRSYSPHLSPAEVEQACEVAVPRDPHDSQAMAPDTAGCPGNVRASPHPDTLQNDVTATITSRLFSSLPEAHNEAKKAILRLLPHGVKFQTYIDEGFDANLIRSLFAQLNLPTDSVPSTASQKPVPIREKPSQEPSTSTQTTNPAPADSTAKKQEERKDRIARLLAEKKAKAVVAPPALSPATTSKDAPKSTTASVAAATKGAATRAENDRLLQQKIALIKARNTQKLSQKAAQSQPVTPQGPTEVVQSPLRPASAAGSTIPLQAQASPMPPVPSKSATPLRPKSVTSSPSMANIPTGPRGLPQLNQRKRPVAADFMDGPALSIKRPFLANRQNSSLVISISDDEDDDDDDDEDDDVEMEVDSATDESSAPAQKSTVLPKRGPVIRDYPPLTNTNTPRQIPSPLSALAGKNSNEDLEAKEKAIEALRRRIEEAEARAKIKPKKGSATPSTPNNGNTSPAEQVLKPTVNEVASPSGAHDKTGENIQRPQKDEAVAGSVPITVTSMDGSNTNTERSAQFAAAATPPTKSAKALAKEERLRRVREELARLEAEMSDDLAEEEEELSQAPTAAETVSSLPSRANLPQAESTALEEKGQTTEHEAATMADEFLASMEHSSLEPGSNDSPPDDGPLDNEVTSQGQIHFDDEQLSMEESTDDDISMSDDYEPPEAEVETHMETPSFGSTPAVPEIANKNAAMIPAHPGHNDTPTSALVDDAEVHHNEPPIQQLAQPVENSREVHDNLPSRADRYLTSVKATEHSPPEKTSFVPYESPLRYFHSYRFHPGYSNEVSGGLKSLTYSNRIDPNKEMCPDEWTGGNCPRGNACQFQHFHAMIAPDNEIILELGNSDEFSGEQKKEFNKRLREMVAQFQKSKIRDFRTIAQAIVDFRRQFVGDPSKILRLEGVTV
ncbi:hypothetical protein BD289DRAFT_473739 [Coniella lustricola]|uniref:C3H1-type domain-containing protein n=1 Tax=Coniella lustricola TaxID=2025994 RepID=A0A2T3AA58_9PEZI|nr:hypothetical protein BD289DRAFT_473739 [Coniella lustricola]